MDKDMAARSNVVRNSARVAQRPLGGIPYLIKATVMLDDEPHVTPEHIQEQLKAKAAAKRKRKQARRRRARFMAGEDMQRAFTTTESRLASALEAAQ